jgi:diguanylate cyclase (GGDEF)-like protein
MKLEDSEELSPTPNRLTAWWLRLASIPKGRFDATPTLRSRMTVLALVMVAGCLAALISGELMWGHSDHWMVVAAMLVLLLLAIFDCMRAGRSAIYSHLLVGGLIALLVTLIVLTGGQSRAALVCLPSIAALAAVLLSPRATMRWTIMILAGLALSAYLRTHSATVYLPLNPQWLESAVERTAAVLTVMTVAVGLCCSVLMQKIFDRLAKDAAAIDDTRQQYQRAEQRLEHYVEMDSAWFWESDEQHRMVYLSSGFERRTGISIKAALGQTPAQITRMRYPRNSAADAAMRPMLERRSFKDQMLSWHEPLTGVVNNFANSASPLFDDKGVFRGFRGRVVNVSERNETLRQVRESVHGDFLTGLMSRRGMLEALDRALIQVRDSSRSAWWLLIDIDRFHEVNSRLNYVQGDLYLKRFARSLSEMAAGPESLSRMDGDEFGMLLLGASRDQVEELATNILGMSRGLRMEFLGADAEGSASIGVVRFSRDSAGVGAILQAAHEACTRAQEAGGARVMFSE